MDLYKPTGSEQRQLKDKSIEYVTLAIEEIRKLSKELAAPRLKVDGLCNSILSVINDMKMASPIQFSFIHDEACELLSSGKKITIFRIVQEQLKNILKHSKARKASIQLQIVNEEVQLNVKDDGIGFDVKQSSPGIGLSNIYERTQFYNGRLSIHSEKGKGCEITVFMPL
jgi:two-component system sensor histidine kinase UhpB